MKFYEMEFSVNEVMVYCTAPYDHPQAVLEEMHDCRRKILQHIACRSDALHFDNQYDDDNAYNEAAVVTFESWMRKFALALHQLEETGHFHIGDKDIDIYFQRKEVRCRFIPDEGK